jgi:hypothetical protein
MFTESGFENTGTHEVTKISIYHVHVTNITLYDLRSTTVFTVHTGYNALKKGPNNSKHGLLYMHCDST